MNNEILEMLADIKSEILKTQTALTFLQYDVDQLRKKLEDIDSALPRESVGIIPNTPPPTWIPPEF